MEQSRRAYPGRWAALRWSFGRGVVLGLGVEIGVAERVGLSLVLGVRPWGLPDFEKFRRKNDATPV